MLIRIKPSLVSTMPWNPTRPLEPLGGRLPPPPLLLLLLAVLAPELLWSLGEPDAFSAPLLPGREPHGMLSRCSGLCMMGELWTLMPGLTARRLKLTGSKSSSRRRLLFMRRVISSALGGWRPRWDSGAEAGAWGVSDRLPSLPAPIMASAGPGPNTLLLVGPDPVDIEGESIFTSSLMPDDEPRGRKLGGGGVTRLPATLLVSEKASQKPLPLEFFSACCLKLSERPGSPSMSSSSTSSMLSPGRFGDSRGALAMSRGAGGAEGTRGSRSVSLSRTCRMTSASRRVSQSTGAPSSARAARIRAKPFVLGCREKGKLHGQQTVT